RTFAMVGRYPFGVLYLTVPPEEVDPNVHPTKSDVRLRHADRVVSAVKEAIATALRHHAMDRLQRSVSFAPPAGEYTETTSTATTIVKTASAPEWAEPRLWPQPEIGTPGQTVRVLAQIDRTFILASDGDAVVLIDQHAAHERIVFEQLAANAGAGVASEPMLVPHTFEVRPEEGEKLDATLDVLAASGLHIEHFGERAYRITATPARLVHAGRTRPFDVADFIDGLSDDVRGLDADQRVWASLACHSVVTAHEALTYPEMTALVERLQRCENPMHCPHGRPTIVRLEPEQISKLFKRV
ncbi:MAG TPA: hypothetical protein VK669_10220, partial [Candidatus Limnocylindrales bacterium]|nr:hypothetical protein [Candidatus Limnocylindrales bacterium]